jgi:hypothetical protein
MRSQVELAACLIETECRDKFASLSTAEERLGVAFKAAHNHWMFTDEQDQFKGAVGAVLISLKEGPEFEKVQKALRQLRKFSALLSALQAGIPVDTDAMLKQQEEEKDETPTIPLNKMWCDVKFGRAAGSASEGI